MTVLEPLRGWVAGRFTVVLTPPARAEWGDLLARVPDDAKRMFEQLSRDPLVWSKRQFPLRGAANKPFWEYEINSGDRAFYCVDGKTETVVIVAIGAHPKTTRETAVIVKRRRKGVVR